MMYLMVIFLGIEAFSRWKETPTELYLSKLWLPAILAVIAAVVTHWIYSQSIEPWVLLALVLSYWIVFTWGREFISRLRNRDNLIAGASRQSRSYYGMLLAHFGVAIMIVGIAMVTVFVASRTVPPFAMSVAGGVALSVTLAFAFTPQMFALTLSRKRPDAGLSAAAPSEITPLRLAGE